MSPEHTFSLCSERLNRVLSPLHYLNQDAPALLKTAPGSPPDYSYLHRLLASTGRHLDLAWRGRTHADPLAELPDVLRRMPLVPDVLR